MISVIIPVYNVKDYLHECVESIFAQTYTDLEIILVDDGSTDGSSELCEDFAKKDARVHVIHQKNQGPSAARNAGLEAMHGDYVAFLDSDDYWLPTAMDHMLSLSQKYSADYVVCPCLRLEPDKSLHPYNNHARANGTEVFDGNARMESYISLRKQTNAVWGKLYTRRLFNEIRFAPGKIMEDVFISYQLIHAASRVVIDETPQYVYRNRANSLMTSAVSIRNYDVIEGRQLEADFVSQHYPELSGHVQARLCSAAVELSIITARGKFSNAEKDRILQAVLRRNLRPYLKHYRNRKRKVIAILDAVSLRMGRIFIRFFS